MNAPGSKGPGQGKRPRRISRYGFQLAEKQRLKEIFGINERQLHNYYLEAQRSEKATGPYLIELLERRLDNAVYRAGFAQTRAAARQLVGHGFFAVDKRSNNIPSRRVSKDMLVTIKENKRKKGPFVNFPKSLQNVQPPLWIQLDPEGFSFRVVQPPTMEEANIGVDVGAIVEFFAR